MARKKKAAKAAVEDDGMRVDSGDLRARAHELAEVVPIVKARLIGSDDVATSNQANREEEEQAFLQAGALEPPYDPEMLCLLFEHSNSLRQNVDAYATNIDGFGHSLAPVFDLDSENIDHRLRRALAAESGKDPSDTEVAELKAALPGMMAEERSKLELFFECCSQDISFVSLRRQTRQDREVMGNGYWEVLRDGEGEISEFVYIPGYMMRLLPQQSRATPCPSRIRQSELKFIEVQRKRRLRLYVQIVETRVVYFKEYGDPRVISSDTGRVYDDEAALEEDEKGVPPATEVIHFKVHSPRTGYGVPRWIGTLLAVLGSRQAEEVNFLYFENKSIPPVAVLVSGGKMSDNAVKRIEDYVKANIRGKRNFHRMLILEAEPAQGAPPGDAGRMRIQIVPLLGAQHNDALFQGYDAANQDKVGMAFRLPRMLRGDVRDFNKSTADAALTFAEMQVFQPEREEFDFLFNRKILPELGIKLWRFKSNAPITRDPVSMSQMVKDLMNANVLTPAEGRALAEDIFNREFKTITEDWTKQPVPLTLAGFPSGGDTSGMPKDTENPQDAAVRPTGGMPTGIGNVPGKPGAKRGGLTQEALRLIALKKAFEYAEAEIARAQRKALRLDELETEVIRIPADEMQALLTG